MVGKCADCLIWEYRMTNFGKPEGRRMTGWCRLWSDHTNQSFGCSDFSSRADQEREYLARVKNKG